MSQSESGTPNASRCRSDEGASLLEYALLVALLVVVCITALNLFSTATSDKFDHSASTISDYYYP
jgi:Flp pilus assembly pilin Flp